MTTRLHQLVRSCLAEQRVALVLAALALAGVVLCDLLAPWPLKVIFDHILRAALNLATSSKRLLCALKKKESLLPNTFMSRPFFKAAST